MFFMSEEDMLGSYSYSGVIDSVERAMLDIESGDVDLVAPLRGSAELGGETLMTMPCLTKRDWGLKVLTIFPDNPARRKPFINGVFLLFDGSDGRPTALLDGRTLTALRTGGVGGLAVRTLSEEGVKSLGIVGAGEQGFWQACFACSVRSFERVSIFDADESRAASCAARLEEALPETKIGTEKDASSLLRRSDVVITATTTRQPLFKNTPSLFKGKTLVGIGSYRPDMREYPDAVFKSVDDVFIDTAHALDETGDLIDPLSSGALARERVRTLGSLLKSPEGEKPSGTFFKSVGFAAFDLYVARHIFLRGMKQGRGMELGGVKSVF
ncbi:MAG: ornithine cyclodeaminase family protein [Synergistaceae bacterium]|nr:ornithine cyclodeaminase family protein [Synergistota bacterium]NLM71436.1 ornithine cyclodeaminase family protein [Synergistaceae bacterium]